MTHDELLAEIDERIEELHNAEVCDGFIHALRAVVELHKPENVYLPNGRGEKIDVCEDCQNDIGQTIYPCPTIQAIQEQLK